MSQQQSAAAHIAAPDKLEREFQPLTERSHQHIDIFFCADTAEQDSIAPFAQSFCKLARIAFKRGAVTRISVINFDRGKSRKLFKA